MSFALPGRILEEYTVRKNRLGLVQFGEARRPIFLDLVPDAHIGDYVRVRVGFATEQVSLEEANREYEELRKTGESAQTVLEAEEAGLETARRRKPR